MVLANWNLNIFVLICGSCLEKCMMHGVARDARIRFVGRAFGMMMEWSLAVGE